jgi:hypothetical protein
MADKILAVERLREVVGYDPMTGAFIRKVRLAQRHQVGDRADFLVVNGTLKGYRRLSIDSKRYLAHRCAWLFVYGEWPKSVVDHIDGSRENNAISNLRDVSSAMNSQNEKKARSNSTTGCLGVTRHTSDRFRARIKVGKKVTHLGMFDKPDDAHDAYVRAKRLLHRGCTI